jgi:hypothetical protein
MADKIIRATVEGPRPTFINGVLHLPGEDAAVDVKALGVDGLGDKTPGLKAKSAKAAEPIAEQPIAAVAPHAPVAPNPQGIAPGTQISGTGRLITPSADPEVAAVAPVGADAPITPEARKEAAAETKQQKPAKPSK